MVANRENIKKQEFFSGINLLKVMAAIGIVMMHMMQNNNYKIEGFLYNQMILSFTDFVFLFMTLSAFGLFCGYYNKYKNNTINWEVFYRKRFNRIFPFFSLLVIIDLLVSPSFSSMIEGFADITLLFGFLPDAGNIKVIGVGWFIGLIFVFYMCFPFLCSILKNRKQLILSLFISLTWNFLCLGYFNVSRKNILFSAPFFMVGIIGYFARNRLLKTPIYISTLLIATTAFVYYKFNNAYIKDFSTICLSFELLWFGLSISKLQIFNKEYLFNIIQYLSAISFDIYLSHMFIFRIIEKLKLNTIFGTGWTQYLITVIIVLLGSILFSFFIKKIINMFKNKKRKD